MMDGNLRKLFKDHLPDFHWQSIETAGTGRGVPDSNYCFKGSEGWVEFKITKGYSVGLRPEQTAWILRRVRAGGRVFVAVRRQRSAGPRTGDAVDQLWLLHGAHAASIKRDGLKKVDPGALAGVWDGGPAHWGWAALRGLLLV